MRLEQGNAYRTTLTEGRNIATIVKVLPTHVQLWDVRLSAKLQGDRPVMVVTASAEYVVDTFSEVVEPCTGWAIDLGVDRLCAAVAAYTPKKSAAEDDPAADDDDEDDETPLDGEDDATF